MVSCIICSKDNESLSRVTENIAATIGTPHEVIGIANPAGKMGICEAYNLGASKARYAVLCFLHEDVRFVTQSWGENVVKHLEDSKVGVIGVAGNVYKSKMLSAWSQPANPHFTPQRINLIQHYKYHNNPPQHLFKNPDAMPMAEVICLDGVFLATSKLNWKQNMFDEKLLKGFHGYDLDFCLQMAQHKKNYVVYDILLEHFSEGWVDKSWFADYLNIHAKWQKKLPMYLPGYPLDEVLAKNIEHANLKFYTKMLLGTNISARKAIKYYTLMLDLQAPPMGGKLLKQKLLLCFFFRYIRIYIYKTRKKGGYGNIKNERTDAQ